MGPSGSAPYAQAFHFQLRISGMSSPYLRMYCLCSISLSRHGLLDVSGLRSDLRQAIDRVHHQVEAVHVVEDRHVERRRDRPLFLVAADVQVVVIRSPIGEAMDQPRIAVVGEDDRLVLGEERVEVVVGQAVRMLASPAAAASGRRR